MKKDRMSMKFLHIADVHLGKMPDEGTFWAEDSTREIYDGFTEFINYAELNPVDFIFVTGDLFDHVPTTKDLFYVDKLFSRLTNTNIIYITGEKDYITRGSDIWDYNFTSRFYLLNGERFNNPVDVEEKADRLFCDGIVDCIRFEKFNLDIYGVCQYNFKNERNDIDGIFIRNLKSVNILLCHGGDPDVSPFEPEEFKVKKFNYVGVGHLHNYMCEPAGKVYYPGSLEPMDVDEVGPHGFIKGYVDEFITNAKLIPNSYRQYKEININVDEKTTQLEVEKQIEDQCSSKGHILTININRSNKCYTDFDLSSFRKKYRVIKITGEKFPKAELLKLESMNLGNVLGQTLKRIRTRKNENDFSAMKKYADFMSEKIWGNTNLGLTPVVTDEETAGLAHNELMKELSGEIDILTEGLALCHNEEARIKMNLPKYPDCTGELNSTRAKLKETQNSLEDVKFKDVQVNKIYSRNRLAFVLLIVAPLSVVLALTLSFGFLEALFWRALNRWLKFTIILIITMMVGGLLFYWIYNNTKRLRKKLFGTPIPAEQHSEYGTKIKSIEIEIGQLENQLEEYQNIHEKHVQLVKNLEEIHKRQEKLRYKLEDIRTIVDA